MRHNKPCLWWSSIIRGSVTNFNHCRLHHYQWDNIHAGDLTFLKPHVVRTTAPGTLATDQHTDHQQTAWATASTGNRVYCYLLQIHAQSSGGQVEKQDQQLDLLIISASLAVSSLLVVAGILWYRQKSATVKVADEHVTSETTQLKAGSGQVPEYQADGLVV